jgi:23S rRNA U2552 (ribose-2'-O)-methylase RlmE/FtsJ
MERGTIEKPPWKRTQWYPAPPKTPQLFDGPVEGQWQEEINEELDTLKESIQPYDKTELWDLAKRITNPYELINTHSSRLTLPQSTCILNPLSRSFFKMTEMLHILQFFDRHPQQKLRSMHVCEGPGGFIEALYEMSSQRNRTMSSSYAMTLRSTHTMIPGWRRASQFLQKHSTVHLLYGPHRTGDIYEPENQEACVEAVGTQGVQIATADGGFDFSDDFHAQERSILRLLVCSSLILLQTVAMDGDIVLKLFDCNSPVTRDLITLLASCFKSWTLYKPVTSRPCNSEWYFLGRSAIRDRKAVVSLLQTVRDGLAAEPPIVYSRLIPVQNAILDIHIHALQKTREIIQMSALKEVLTFCKDKPAMDADTLTRMWEIHRDKTVHWCNDFRMPTYYKLKH